MTLRDKVRNRATRLRQHRWRMRPYQSTQRHIVVGGSPGSGTTLLRRILDRHPRIASGPETRLLQPGMMGLEPLAARSGIDEVELQAMVIASGSQAEFIDLFAERYLATSGKSRWCEKTPNNVLEFDWTLARFPRARLIHIIRDGRDVVCSMAEHPDWRWTGGGWRKTLRRRSTRQLAADWVRATGAGMRFRTDARYHEIRYEDLVMAPEPTLRSLCMFLEEAFDERMLRSGRAPRDSIGDHRSPDQRPIFASSLQRWRRDLSAPEQRQVLQVAASRLAELGYT